MTVSFLLWDLTKNVWNRRSISVAAKIKIYWAVVLNILLYDCETWTTYQRHIQKLNHFHTSCLRKILSITCQKYIPDTFVVTRVFFPVSTPSWWNHSFVGPVILSTWKITDSRRNCFAANYLQPDLSASPLMAWNIWRMTETSGVKLSNVEWKSVKPEEMLQLSYAVKGTGTSSTAATIPCSHCPRFFRAPIGLISYLHTHGSRPHL